MARVIDTPSGALWVSKVNAGSLERGDQIVMGNDEHGYSTFRVVDNRQTIEPGGRIKLAGGQRWIEVSKGVGFGKGIGFPAELNEPIYRVTGSRSGGCC